MIEDINTLSNFVRLNPIWILSLVSFDGFEDVNIISFVFIWGIQTPLIYPRNRFFNNSTFFDFQSTINWLSWSFFFLFCMRLSCPLSWVFSHSSIMRIQNKIIFTRFSILQLKWKRRKKIVKHFMSIFSNTIYTYIKSKKMFITPINN